MQTRLLSEDSCQVRTSTTDRLTKALSVTFWLLVWHIAARAIGQRILLVSPVDVIIRLVQLMGTAELWTSSLFSTLRIASGFLLALVSATVLASLSWSISWVRILVEPVVRAFKVVPVASITIVVLIWVSSRNLSVIISFMMVFPVLYSNILSALEETDRGMLEMARMYRIGFWQKLRLVYIPQVYPYFLSSSSLSLGLAWKSGVAAEVIGIPDGSLGERLYDAKVFFATADVFAYTVLIVILSIVFEIAMKKAMGALGRRLEAV